MTQPRTGPRARPVAAARPVRLGLRANLAQFSLLVGVNALVGGMIGQERTVLPLLATQVFHLRAFTAALTFILAFGVVKAATNFFAGTLSDRIGRKPVLVAGWLVGLPVPLLLLWAPTWGWIILANVLLGINQGLTWSTTVIMKIDLAGPQRRGLAMGLNEAAGYGAVAITALATGFIAAHAGLRPQPFFLGLAYAGLGLGLSALLVRETRAFAQHEAATHVNTSAAAHQGLSTRQVFLLTSFKEKALSAASQAGMVNNLNDGLAWGIFPLLFASYGLSVSRIGILAALYPAVWGAGQLLTGALSDRVGRKWLIATGMWTQALAIGLIAAVHGFAPWAAGALLLGAGTAMVYPTLLAAIGDVAHPRWRASSVGVYRLWRDGGFAVGALLAGVVADLLGLTAAIWTVAALTAASGVVVAVRMYETHPPHRPNHPDPPGPPPMTTQPAATRHPWGVGDMLRFATFLAPTMLPVYQLLADRIARRLDRPVQLVVGASFDQFARGEADLGVICGLPYVRLAARHPAPLRPLAAPVLAGRRYAGRPVYYSDIIVHRDSRATRLEELRGCSWAYNDLDSHSGHTLTLYELVRRGLRPGFFGRVVQAGFHRRALRLVARGDVDAAAIDSQVLAVELRDHPDLAANLRVIEAFGPSTIQPVVAAAHLPDHVTVEVRDLLVTLGDDPNDRAAGTALAHGFIQRFAPSTTLPTTTSAPCWPPSTPPGGPALPSTPRPAKSTRGGIADAQAA